MGLHNLASLKMALVYMNFQLINCSPLIKCDSEHSGLAMIIASMLSRHFCNALELNLSLMSATSLLNLETIAD